MPNTFTIIKHAGFAILCWVYIATFGSIWVEWTNPSLLATITPLFAHSLAAWGAWATTLCFAMLYWNESGTSEHFYKKNSNCSIRSFTFSSDVTQGYETVDSRSTISNRARLVLSARTATANLWLSRAGMYTAASVSKRFRTIISEHVYFINAHFS